jgi:hypothetical protein
MKDDLNRHLDGEIPREQLSAEARLGAEAWDRLLDSFRMEPAPSAAPPWLETRVMAEIEALPARSIWRRIAHWLTRPRELRVSPLTGGLVAAALATVLLLNWPDRESPIPGTVAGGDPGSSLVLATDPGEVTVYVQFALEAPGAASVSVGGDFDGWEGSHSLSDADGDGVWTGRVPVNPGLHAYMFLVDGSSWVTDPRADRYAEDGFGNRNALLAVAAPSV